MSGTCNNIRCHAARANPQSILSACSSHSRLPGVPVRHPDGHMTMLCYPMLYAMLCYAMPCYAMLRYAMLCYAMLCYAMPCHAMLCYAMLCYAVLRYAVLCCAMLHAMLCRAYCNRSQDVMTPDEERAIWIPGRLLTAATRDPELFSYILDTVLRNGLFPARLESKAAAGHWAVVFMNCGEQERSAVLAVLRAKARQQQDVHSFLTVRGTLSINQPTNGLSN